MKKIGPCAPRVKALRGLLVSIFLLISIVVMVNAGSYNVEALDPHIVTGTVYEANGTLLPSANVTIVNARTSDSSNATSNATGVYSFNLLNLPLGWLVGDTMQVNTTNATAVGGSNSTQIKVGTTSTTIDIWIGTTTNVSGVTFYVVDKDGYPVNDAYVNVKDSDGDIETTQKTGTNGRATTDLNNGLYTITVSKSGYDDVTEEIRVHGTSNYAVRIGEAAAVDGLADFLTLLFWLFVIIGGVFVLTYLIRKAR